LRCDTRRRSHTPEFLPRHLFIKVLLSSHERKNCKVHQLIRGLSKASSSVDSLSWGVLTHSGQKKSPAT